MIEITAEALEQLQAYHESEGGSKPVRLAIMSGASSSPNLGIMVEEKNDKDVSFDFDGFEVIIDQGLLDYCKNIHIEFVSAEGESCSVAGGLKITPEQAL